VPAWFVRYDALVQAAAAADLDLPVLVNAAVRGRVGVAPLDGMVVDGRLPRPAGRTGRLAAR
jgi:hypothetical protein